MNAIDTATDVEKTKDEIDQNNEVANQNDSELEILVRKIEFPVKPRGVLAE